jgi:hypothetical protein
LSQSETALLRCKSCLSLLPFIHTILSWYIMIIKIKDSPGLSITTKTIDWLNIMKLLRFPRGCWLLSKFYLSWRVVFRVSCLTKAPWDETTEIPDLSTPYRPGISVGFMGWDRPLAGTSWPFERSVSFIAQGITVIPLKKSR